MINYLQRLKLHIHNICYKPVNKKFTSYAQCGEDLIVNYIFDNLSISKPTYLDIGTHHPCYLNNTYFFYLRGSRGVCIEPDPMLFKEIMKKRKNDICLNIGIDAKSNKKALFHVMSTKTLNTFSRQYAKRYQSYNHQRVEQIVQVKIESINTVLSKYFQQTPNFISIDTEGLDFKILKAINFRKFRPEVICIETLTYTENKTEYKIPEISKFITSKGYFMYADTYINTIFVNKDSWANRK